MIFKLDSCIFASFLANSPRMLEFLGKRLASASSVGEKISILESLSCVSEFLDSHPVFRAASLVLSQESKMVFYQMIAIDQAQRIFAGIDETKKQAFQDLLEKLIPIDYFYREMGGIVGYQLKILELLKSSGGKSISDAEYHAPAFLDIAEETPSVRESIAWGIDSLPQIAEIYPLGGAADRLHLLEEKTGVELPAAKLRFAGRTLFENLIRDLQAREYLYFQKHKVQLTTPIAVMTSQDKNNHFHVTEICRELGYFGRPIHSIRFFTQPLVPAVNEEGNWCLMGPFNPLLKPGGHGAIWKLARDSGVFDWLEKLERKKALIRQINNPIAGLDYGLLAFLGVGCKRDMHFGFASCPRLLQAAEGVNVLIEKKQSVVLTNIEYCDFAKFGIEDRPLKEGEPYSRFSSNTNILFADLKAISGAVDKCPFPGLLINLKKAFYATDSGEKKEESIARLESTMQNIADVFVEEKGCELKTERTFVTYNQRHKTISTAKKAFAKDRPLQETPENCFYDLLSAHRELLIECGFELPEKHSLETYLRHGPEYLFLYHPALGPLYSIIKNKLRKGALSIGSELILEIADFSARNLQVQGSLRIIAEQPLGHFDSQGILHFSDQIGSCILENVTIENKGVDWTRSEPFWKMNLQRDESVQIILKGKSQFVARDLHLKGSHTFIVEDGSIMSL